MLRKHAFVGRPVQLSEATERRACLFLERGSNRRYARGIRACNLHCDMRISSRCTSRDFGFCNANKPDTSPSGTGVVVRDGRGMGGVHQNLNVVITSFRTNLVQCSVELMRALPPNICRLVCRLGSNHQKGLLVGDELTSDAADDRESHDSRQHDECECSRWDFHTTRWFDSAHPN